MTGPTRLLDITMVLVCTAGVLSVLDDSLTPRATYLAVGLVPVMLLIVLALLLASRPSGGWIFVLVGLLLYAPLGALLALRDPGPFILPTPETMSRVLGGTVAGPLSLVTTLPPVEVTGDVALVPYMVGFLAGGSAAWLALGTTRAVAPVLPLLAGLAATIGLGSLVPAGLVLRGAVLAGLLVWWAGVRARRARRTVGSGRGAMSHALLGAAVVGLTSGLVVVVVPDDSEVDRVLLRGRLGDTLDAADVSDPIGPDESTLTEPEVLLRTSGIPRGTPLRFAALDTYTDAGWVVAGESPGAGPTGRFQRIGEAVTPLHDGPRVRVAIEVQPAYSSDWLPTLGELTSLELDYTDGRTQLSEVRYNQVTGTAFVNGGVDPRDTYTVGAVLTPDGLPRRFEPADADAEQRQPAGAFLDGFLDRFVQRGREPARTLRAYLRHLKDNGAVRLHGDGSDLTRSSLRDVLAPPRIVGTPHQYAAIVALAASRLGIPGRVVVGAFPDGRGRVRTDDVTSWVEVQVVDGTWRRIDPGRYLGTRRLDVPGADGAGGTPGTVGPGSPSGAGRDVELPKGTAVDVGPGGDVPDSGPELRRVLAWVAASLAALLLLGLVLVPVVKLLRRRTRRSRARWADRYAGGWQEVVDLARDRGTPVPDQLGRVPQARLLQQDLALARRTESTLFAPGRPTTEEEEQFWAAVEKECRHLTADLSVRRRVMTVFNPSSLVAGWRRRRR